jgi:hypothetical protein
VCINIVRKLYVNKIKDSHKVYSLKHFNAKSGYIKEKVGFFFFFNKTEFVWSCRLHTLHFALKISFAVCITHYSITYNNHCIQSSIYSLSGKWGKKSLELLEIIFYL